VGSGRNFRQAKVGKLLLTAVAGGIGLVCCLVTGRYFVAVDRIEHFPPVNRHFLRGLDPQADFVPPDLDDHDRNVIIDDNTLVFFAG
jgi:hypothetical protein